MVGFRKINKFNGVKGITSRLSLGVRKGAKTDQSKTSADTPDTTPEVTPEQHAEPLRGPESAAAGPNAGRNGGTEADEVLSGILKDLSIDPDIAIRPNKTDDVSEYSGGSAKSVEVESSQVGTKEISIGEKVNMVIAAAEEIRRKKNSALPQGGAPLATASSGDSPTTEIGESPAKEVKTNRRTPPHHSADKHAGDTGKEPGLNADFSTDFEGQDFQDDKAVLTSTEDQTFEDDPTKEGSLTDDTTFSEDNTDVSGDVSREVENSPAINGNVMNKDIVIQEPGGPNNLVVRAMYHTLTPSTPEEVIIKVEVSRMAEFFSNSHRC